MRWMYPFAIGVLFGTVQTGYFLRLSFALSSTYSTFLMITLAWLAGSAFGLHFSRWVTLRTGLLLCLVPYALTQVIVSAAPFQVGLWWLYVLMIACSGVYSGVFFAHMGKRVAPVRHLFFAENNGFLTGIAAFSLLYLLSGRLTVWVIPVTMMALCWLITPADKRVLVVSIPDHTVDPVEDHTADQAAD